MTGIFLLFSSCGKNNSVVENTSLPPDSVISKDQMVKMLAEIHILESGLQLSKKKDGSEKEMSFYYYNRFFSGYRMSEKRFRKNLDLYHADTEEFLKLYEEVIKDLEKRIDAQKTKKPPLD